MNAPKLNQAKLDEIAEEFSGAIRRGEQPSVESYVAKYSDPTGELSRLLKSIEMIEGLKPKASDRIHSTSDESSSSIKQLDDYKILREIGRGGMGVVFEAIHQSLGRRVAIKVLAHGLLGDNKHLARFRREARAAARLRHSNIVTVFGVGTSQQHHYYVMDFIDGMTLRQWVESITGKHRVESPTLDEAVAVTDGDLDLDGDLETPPSLSPRTDRVPIPLELDSDEYYRWIAGLGRTISDALQYAHAQGVLHRDIKPANLLIDRQGEVWVADFGLAKLSEQQEVTATGDIVGTPQYMPPESFDGDYDVRSEIYGVGLTLYELLARRPAIEGRNAGDVIRKASEGVSVSPRKINPSVPRDLETIVLKALAHEPRDRYASAEELRDDLDRFLNDLPISARRTGILERAARWTRREPVVASLTFATFGLLLALALVAALGYARTKDALNVAEAANQTAETSLQQRTEALENAEQQRLRAEANLQVALSAFDEIMQNIADRDIDADAELLGEVTDTTSPHVTPDDAKLLQSLLGFFDELAANNSEDLLAESAVAAQRSGNIYLRLGNLRDADRAYTDALNRFRQLGQRSDAADTNVESIVTQAEVMNELAVVTAMRGQLNRADQMFDRTVRLLENAETAMSVPSGQFQYARAHRIFASVGARIGFDSITTASRLSGRSRRPLNAIMRVRTDEQLGAIDTAIDTLNGLIEEHDDARYRAELARAYRDKAKVALRSNRYSVSEQAVRRSIEVFEDLLKENRRSVAIRYELAMTLSSTEAFSFNQMLRAIRADEFASDLLAESPELPRYQALKAHTLETMAAHQQKIGRLVPAEKNLTEASQIYDGLISDYPQLTLYEMRRSQTLETLADISVRKGARETAIEYLERGVQGLQPKLRRSEVSPVGRMQMQRMRQKLTRIRESS